MGEYGDRDRYIPFRKRDIVEMILKDGRLETDRTKRDFERFCEILESVFHFEFHKKLEDLKDTYYPMNPDLYRFADFGSSELRSMSKKLFETLQEVLKNANFEEISQEEIEEAYAKGSALQLKIVFDQEDYECIHFFYRGRRKDEIMRKKYFGLKTDVYPDEILERVVLFVQFKPKEYYERKGMNNVPFEPGSTMIKLFKDVPTKDLEMLFPNSKIVMGLKDKLILAVPAIAGGIPLLISKVLPALIVVFVMASAYFGYQGAVEKNQLKQAIAAFTGGAALAGFCLKQWTKYKNKRYKFQKELSDNLYFRNLVNNDGVFHWLIDAAEEEECKEAFLAYYFLSVTDRDLTERQLDEVVEEWFRSKHGCKLDFEIDDALNKLERLDLLTRASNGVLKVPELKGALERLDTIWDNYFPYNSGGEGLGLLEPVKASTSQSEA